MTEIPQSTIDEFVGAAHGDFARVRSILDQYPTIINASASWNEIAVQAATQTGQVELIRFLLEKGAPLDIYTAAVLGMKDEVERLIQKDPQLAAAPGVHGIPSLFFPAIGGQLEIAQLMHQHGAAINAGAGGNTPLHGAVLSGSVDMAKWLLDSGAEVNALDYEKRTPLKLASAAGDTAMVELLKDYGGTE